MDTLRLLLTVTCGLCVICAVGWTMARRRAHEAERSQGAEVVARREGVIRDLAAQLSAAARGLRRLRVLEAMVEMVRR